ncbi:MAG: GNAT family N-acetyltransferase [Clostridia bacterium]|nr:GNAT family N-acetyltransferase [Clostridia bacterium]
MNTPIDISNKKITTERLTLRPWRPSDLDDLFGYASVDGVGQMAGWMPHKDRDESLGILNMFIEGKKTFALERRGRVIGSLGIEEYSEDLFPEYAPLRCRELGFVLAKDQWGQGLMPEAVDAVCRWLLEEESLDVLFCGHFDWNRQSARVQEKCGFHEIAQISKYMKQIGKTENVVFIILTKEDYLFKGGQNT